MARRFALLLVLAGAALLVSSAVALAVVRTGTNGVDRLTGTADNDKLTGKGGNDTTVGKAGNDVYYYADGWGQDTVIDSKGIDTLNFSAVAGGVTAQLCPAFGEGTGGQATGGAGDSVTFGSRIEGVRGSQESDTLVGCGGKNTLSGGSSSLSGQTPLGGDLLLDFDGMELFGSPASDDTYLASNRGAAATVADGGGAADILNLAGFSFKDADVVGVDLDNDGDMGSLGVIYGSDGTLVGQMLLTNQFEDDEFASFSAPFYFDGRIEKIKFKNTTISVTPGMAAPASARQSALFEETVPAGHSREDLMP